ncbi:MAG: Txe/YoeB family addiction module toxin [Pseudolabrys sp.]
MRIVWTSNAWDDYLHWQKNDQKVMGSINDLIKDIKRDPFKGLGKPEPLKHALQGFWSRRITHEDRFVYRVTGKGYTQQIEIIQCRYHY